MMFLKPNVISSTSFGYFHTLDMLFLSSNFTYFHNIQIISREWRYIRIWLTTSTKKDTYYSCYKEQTWLSKVWWKKYQIIQFWKVPIQLYDSGVHNVLQSYVDCIKSWLLKSIIPKCPLDKRDIHSIQCYDSLMKSTTTKSIATIMVDLFNQW